jgi:uncharacterized ubiquitin-like protein YukD
MIPKLIHQTWRDNTLPVLFQKIKNQNKTMNEDFEFKLWSHTPGPPDIDDFIKKEYPDIFDIFNKTKYGVQKADIARIVILYHYGGIYFDLDIMCLKPLKTLLNYESDHVYVALEPSEQTKKVFNKDNLLCNAFIAAPPKHALFKQALEEIKTLYKTHGDAIYNIFNAFGADLVAKSMSNDDIFKECKFINRKLLYPINDPKLSDLPSTAEDARMIQKGDFGNAYTVHYWIHSDFESKELLEKFDYDDNESIHSNVYRFFKILYPTNKHLV